jgi:hypothetical protein
VSSWPDPDPRAAETAQRLAVHGVARGNDPGAEWLVAVGAARRDGPVLRAVPEWYADSLPARSERDLLRRLVFRDPAYRAYLDRELATVLRVMAEDGRMERVEALLCDELRLAGPRLALALREAVPGQRRSSGAAPGKAASDAPGEAAGFARDVDDAVFGAIPGGTAQRFPALVEQYGPHAADPVWVRLEIAGLEPQAAGLLAAVVLAAADGEGVYLPGDLDREYEALMALRLPIRRWGDGQRDQAIVAAVSPIGVLTEVTPPPVGLHRAAPRIPLVAAVRRSRIVADRERPLRVDTLWEAAAGAGRMAAHPTLDLGATSWPVEASGPSGMDGMRLPGAATLAQRAPDALALLASHPLFGLLLQLTILDAFGRELNDQRLTLLLVGPAERPARVDVYYRPLAEGPDRPTRRLGSADDVLPGLAAGVGIDTVPRLYESEAGTPGPWTAGLLLLWRAGVLTAGAGAASRELYLERTVFDALHAGRLMHDVIRRGGRLRDTLQTLLRERWEALEAGERGTEAEPAGKVSAYG